jgi:hypothetical protein
MQQRQETFQSPPFPPPPLPTSLHLIEPSNPRSTSPAIPQPPPAASNPFTDTDDKEKTVDTFFTWKEKKIKLENIKIVIQNAYQIILCQIWNLKNLKKIENSITS